MFTNISVPCFTFLIVLFHSTCFHCVVIGQRMASERGSTEKSENRYDT